MFWRCTAVQWGAIGAEHIGVLYSAHTQAETLAWLNTAFGWPTIAVDTHIFRVSNRTGIAPGKNVLEVEKKLLKFVPKDYLLDAHHWLILHGRYVCQARKPRCWDCSVSTWCKFKPKTAAPA